MKGRAITRGDLFPRRLSWQPSVKIEVEGQKSADGIVPKKKNREGLNMSDKDMIDTYIENAMKVENRKKKIEPSLRGGSEFYQVLMRY